MLIESYAEIVAQAEQQPDASTPQLHRADLQAMACVQGRRLSIQTPTASCGSSGSIPRRRKRKKNQRVTYCLNGNVFANSRLRVKFCPRVPGLSMDKRRNIRNLNFDLARPLSDEDEDEREDGVDDDDDDSKNYSRIQGQCVEKRRNIRHLNFDQARQLSDDGDDESEFSQEKQQQQEQEEEEEEEQSVVLAGPVCNATYALIKPNNNNNYIIHNSNELPSLDFGLTMNMEMSSYETTNATRTQNIRQQKRTLQQQQEQLPNTLPTAQAAERNESQRSVSSSTQSSTIYLLGHHLQTSHRLPEIRITTLQRPHEPSANPHRQLIASLNGLFVFIIFSVVLLLAITLYQPVHVGP